MQKAVRIMPYVCLISGLIVSVLAESIWIRGASTFIILAAVFALLRLGKKRASDEYENSLLRILSIYRHDWMNHIQVLLGYIRLNKPDRLHDYVGKINAKVYQESYLTKMGVPSLAVYYYTFRAGGHPLELEFEIEQEIALSRLPEEGKLAAAFIKEMIELFTEQAPRLKDEAGLLSLAFDEEEEYVLLDVIYQGELGPRAQEKLQAFFRRKRKDGLSVEQEWSEGGAAITVRLPFQPK